jgi:hypothetical protein
MLIAKMKALICFSYESNTIKYEVNAVLVFTHASSVWGCDTFYCMYAVQKGAARYFLNVGRYTQNAAVCGDIC